VEGKETSLSYTEKVKTLGKGEKEVFIRGKGEEITDIREEAIFQREKTTHI